MVCQKQDVYWLEHFTPSVSAIRIILAILFSNQSFYNTCQFDRNSGIRIIQPSTVGMGYTLGENIVRIRGIFFCFTFTIYILAGGRGSLSQVSKIRGRSILTKSGLQQYRSNYNYKKTSLCIERYGTLQVKTLAIYLICKNSNSNEIDGYF